MFIQIMLSMLFQPVEFYPGLHLIPDKDLTLLMARIAAPPCHHVFLHSNHEQVTLFHTSCRKTGRLPNVPQQMM